MQPSRQSLPASSELRAAVAYFFTMPGISETSRALGTGYDSALPSGVNTWPSLIAIAEELCGGAPPGWYAADHASLSCITL